MCIIQRIKSIAFDTSPQKNIAPVVLGGIAAGAGSLLGGIMGAGSSSYGAKQALKATRETNAMNYKIWQEQLAYNDAMNQWNSASKVKKRYQDAGINPYLAMENGSLGVGSTPPGTPTMQSGADSIMSGANNTANILSNIGSNLGNTLANVSQGISQGVKTSFEIDKMISETYQNMKHADNETMRTYYQNRLDFLSGEQTKASTLLLKQQEELTKQQIATEVEKKLAIQVQNKINEVNLDWLPKEKQAQLENIVADTVLKGVQADLNRQEIKESVSRTVLNYANKNLVDSEKQGQNLSNEYQRQVNYEQRRDSGQRRKQVRLLTKQINAGVDMTLKEYDNFWETRILNTAPAVISAVKR